MRPIPRITESESGISNTTWLSVGKPVFASTIEQWSLLAQCRNHSGAFSVDQAKAKYLRERLASKSRALGLTWAILRGQSARSALSAAQSHTKTRLRPSGSLHRPRSGTTRNTSAARGPITMCSACRKLPDVGVKARCFGEIAAHKFDAAHTTNEARRHSQAATACRRLSPSADLALV